MNNNNDDIMNSDKNNFNNINAYYNKETNTLTKEEQEKIFDRFMKDSNQEKPDIDIDNNIEMS